MENHLDIEDENETKNKNERNKKSKSKTKLGNNTNANSNITGNSKNSHTSTKKEIIKNKLNFEEYFQAYKNRRDFITSESDAVNKLDFTAESYNEVIEKMKKNSQCRSILQEESKLENEQKINIITEKGLFDVIIELLVAESNVFLYGFGSKLKFVYNFIHYFQETINSSEEGNYHLLVFNCYNPEMNIKFILNEIQNYMFNQLDSLGYARKETKELMSKFKNIESQIVCLGQLKDKLVEKEISCKFLIIMNNIDGPNFQSKAMQTIISHLIEVTKFRFLTTSDNLYINYFWTQTIKDNFSFYYLKYHTFTPYELEINDKNSLTGEKNIKAGNGLESILRSLTKNQRDILKIMAEIQLKGDLSLMTPKNLVDFLVDNGYGICNNQNRFMELILEPLDHEIIVERMLKNNKQIYKLNLDEEILEKIKNGDFDIEEENYKI